MPQTKVEEQSQVSKDKANSYIMHPRQAANLWVKGRQNNPNLFGMSNKDAAQGRINAKTALRVRAMLLETLESRIATQYAIIYDPEATDEERAEAQTLILKFISSDVNTMLRDAEMRGLGAPKQEISLKREDKRLEDMTDEELEGILIDGESEEIEDAEIVEDDE